jgi:nucleotide-binding universal stress UspA family protein
MRKSLYLKILVPIDGSSYSNKALAHACELAKAQKAVLLLIYVVDKSIPINFLDRKEYLSMLRKYGEKIMKKASSTTNQRGVSSKQIIKEGNVAKEIIKTAKNEKCNLIIVGNKGLGAAARFLLGSTSTKLAADSPCSVLIVK